MRNTDCTPEVIAAVAKNIAEGLCNRDAARNAGIGESTFYAWLKRGKAELARVAKNPGRRKLRPREEPFVEFVEAIKRAIPERKKALLAQIQKAAHGGEEILETRRIYKRVKVKGGKNDGGYRKVLVEETISTKTSSPQWQAAAWLLERLHPDEFGKRSRLDVHTWQHELSELIRSGLVTVEEVEEELGPDLAAEFFESAGLTFAGVVEAET